MRAKLQHIFLRSGCLVVEEAFSFALFCVLIKCIDKMSKGGGGWTICHSFVSFLFFSIIYRPYH